MFGAVAKLLPCRCLIEIAMRSDLYHCGAVEFADVRPPDRGESQPDPFCTTRGVSPIVRPIDISLLERDKRREFKPLRIADFVKRRFAVCAIVDAWARG